MKEKSGNIFFCIRVALLCNIFLLNVPNSSATPQASLPDSNEYFNENFLRYSNFIYHDYIKSVELFKQGVELSDPILPLNSGEQLLLKFDDLQGNIKQYYLSAIHCDANWHPTEIWTNEYLEGSQEEPIDKFDFSFNTRQSYTHYEAIFPNEHMMLKLSGNYILKVYTKTPDGNEIPAITCRFLVYDSKLSIDARVTRASTVEETETNQEIDFSVSTSGYRIDAPYQDIQVYVLQNFRWDNALNNLKPYMVKGDVLDYSFDNGSNQFAGGNEFRHFDIKSLKYLSDKVKDISYEKDEFKVRLWEGARRTFRVYLQDDDINGKFLLKTEDEPAVETNGEYAWVHFFLPYQAPIVEGSLYIGGGFNNWQYTSENKMKYNYELHGYEAEILLKQGYYNYLFTLLPNNSSKGDVTFIEGSHYETGNNYTILVYYHERGTLYDQLIAFGSFDSRK